MYVCETSKFLHCTYMIIFNQMTEPKMTLHLGFLNLYTAVTTDDDIPSQMTEAEMTVHIGFQISARHVHQFPVKDNGKTKRFVLLV